MLDRIVWDSEDLTRFGSASGEWRHQRGWRESAILDLTKKADPGKG